MKERLKKLRKSLGLTQGEFGKKIGMSDVAISYMESGRTALSGQNIKLICLTFGVRAEWLQDGNGDMMDEEAQLSDYERRLLALFRRLSPNARITLIEYTEKTVAIEAAARGETPGASKQAPGGTGRSSEAPQEGETPGIGPIPRKDGDTG
jgi:transcriptional regulator with XRE-family HTH domain